MVKIRIVFAGPADDATTAPDSAPTLRESIMSRLTPQIRCATLPRLAIDDEVDENRSAALPLQPASAP